MGHGIWHCLFITSLIVGIYVDGSTGEIAGTINVTDRTKSIKSQTLDIDFYSGCEAAKFCFGSLHEDQDKNCISSTDCDYATSVKKLNNTNSQTKEYQMVVMFDHTKSQYLGIGIGRSENMMNLAVLECVKDQTGKAVGYTSWVGSERARPSRTDATPKIDLTAAGIEGNRIACTFKLPQAFDLPGIGSVDLKKEAFHLLLAWGPISDTGALRRHATGSYKVSNDKMDFTAEPSEIVVKQQSKSGPGIYQLHGVLMTVVYLGLMPIGTIIARFYKETWSTIKVFNKRLWYIIHVSLMLLALILGLIAYLIIPIATGKWWPSSETSQNHAILGAVSLVLIACQSIVPWFIPLSKLLLKKVYFMGHAIMGLSCYVLGLANIILASSWVSWVQPCEGIFVTLVWIAAHCSMYILLTTLLYLKDFELEEPPKNCRARLSFPMRVLTMDDAPGGIWRKVFLACFITISIIICVTMSVLIYYIGPCR